MLILCLKTFIKVIIIILLVLIWKLIIKKKIIYLQTSLNISIYYHDKLL